MPPLLFGLFDWVIAIFGERMDPGEQGSLAVEAPEVRWRPGFIVFVHALLALAGLVYLIVIYTLPDWEWMSFWFALLVIYIFAAHYLIPEADTSNLGWLGASSIIHFAGRMIGIEACCSCGLR